MSRIKGAAHHVTAMVRSGTTSGNERVMTLAATGHDVLALSGVPPWGPPAELVAEAFAKVTENTQVASSAGSLGLREAIVRKLSQDNGISVSCDNVLVTNGAKEAIQVALHCVGAPGSEVVVPIPSYPYQGNLVLAGLRPVYVPATLHESYQLDVDKLEAAISPRTSAILLNNPVNPTGRVFTNEEVIWLAELAVRHDLWLIVDESFEKLVYSPARHVSMASLDGVFHRTITLQTFSKAHGMGPWRLGYMVGGSELIEQAHKVHEWLVLSVNLMSQMVAQAVLDGPQDWVNDYLGRFQAARDVAVDALEKVRDIQFYRPDAGGNVFIDVSKISGDSEALSSYLLSELGVSTLPGAVFGDPTAIRFPFGGPLEKLRDALSRLNHGISSYHQ